jgi:hypothetical protein
MSKLRGIPGARTYAFTGPDQSWRAHVKQNSLGCEVRVELFGLGDKPPTIRLTADDWRGVDKVLRKLGANLSEIGKSLSGATLEEPK